MGTSSITISALSATPTLRGNKLQATVVATGPAANLPNLLLDVVEFWSSTTNDLTTATLIDARSTGSALDAGLIEEQTYYYWARAKNRVGSYGAYYPVSPTGGVACTATGMSGLAFGLANGQLRGTVAGGILTVAIKTAAGIDPSTADPVFIAFPNTTLTIGSYQIRRISAALAVTISNASTLGAGTGPFRIWAVIFDDNGVLKLGARVCSTPPSTIYPMQDTGIAEFVGVDSGSGGATSFGYFYTNSALTNKSYRIIGYLDFTSGQTPGTWTVAPDMVRLTGQGLASPGQVVQEVFAVDATGGGTSTSLIPFDNTIPQIGEGFSLIGGIALTPKSPCNFFEFDILYNFAHTVASELTMALFQDSGANAIASSWVQVAAANAVVPLRLKTRQQAATAAQRSYDARAGADQAGTTTKNGVGGAAKLGGTLIQYVSIKEILG